MIRLLIPLCLLLGGCFSAPKLSPTSQVTNAISSSVAQDSVNGCSPMLGWLGGICALGGMALLVITGGKMGWRPIIGGILFVLINYALALYADWIFLPVLIATAAISLAWAGKIIWKIVNDDDIKLKELKL